MAQTPEQILQQYWGYSQFRPPQLEIINAVLQKRDTLALLPTGGGKSLCFQLPGLLIEGLCLVITPLIALMNDQVEQLKQKKISAIALHSGMGRREMDIALDNCAYGKVKFLYLSPERIQTALFVERVKKMPVQLVAVDEAHCISEWGYDFRPSYLKIAALREIKPEATWIALTATATAAVKKDILLRLQLQNPVAFQKSFARTNISFVVRNTENKEKQLLNIVQKVDGPSILYTQSRKHTEQLSLWLNKAGLSATFYHAGLTYEERTLRQQAWISGNTRIMVATSAFGMGIDKANVRTVVHTAIPETLEAYYQEAGRAGRDGKQSYAIMIYCEQDIKILRDKIRQSNPTPVALQKIYQALSNYYGLAIGSAEGECFEWDIHAFCRRFRKTPSLVRSLLKRLEEQGLITLHEGFCTPPRAYFQGDKKSLYTAQVANRHYDQLIKAMLRIYGAELLSGFTTISEAQIARTLKWSIPAVGKTLTRLHELQLVRYEPASNSPQITFVMARQEATKLPLDKVKLATRGAQARRRLEAIVAYAQQTHRCRMQVVQSYFDEETFDRCGRCDVCMEKNKQAQQPATTNYTAHIRTLLGQKPMTVKELEKAIKPDEHNTFARALREMLETAEIWYDEYWVLRRG